MKRLGVLLLLLPSGVAFADHDKTGPARPATLMAGLGKHHHPVSTNNPEAQQFFDQQLKAAARLPGAYGQTHSLPITAVQGIGDQADDVAAQLFVRKGAVIFAVSIATPLDESQTPAFAQKRKTLAQAIVRRI